MTLSYRSWSAWRAILNSKNTLRAERGPPILRREHWRIGGRGSAQGTVAASARSGARAFRLSPGFAVQAASGELSCVRPESDGAVAGLRNNGWEADERPEPRSLGLLPSGPDPVGEWLVHRQPPVTYIGRGRPESKRGRFRRLGFCVSVGLRLSALGRRRVPRKGRLGRVRPNRFRLNRLTI